MELYILFFAISFGTCFILLYERKKKWATDKVRWIITLILALFGVIGVTFYKKEALKLGLPLLAAPIIYNCFDRWFKNLSIKKNGRDFYLYLSNSDEIDTRLFAKNPHVKFLDKLFSFLLLIIIFGINLTLGLFFKV